MSDFLSRTKVDKSNTSEINPISFSRSATGKILYSQQVWSTKAGITIGKLHGDEPLLHYVK